MILKKPVVCIIAVNHPTFDHRAYYKEALSLVKAGYEVHLIVRHTRDETVGGVHIHGLPTPPNRLARILVWPWRAFRKVLTLPHKPDICHFHEPGTLPVGLALHLLGYTVIFDVRENLSGQILDKYWIPKHLRWLVAMTFRSFEVYATLGMGIVETDMIEGRYRQPKQSVRNLPNKTMLDLAPRPRADFEGKPILIYSGAISTDRGAFYMLELARELRQRGLDFEMRIVGPASPEELADEMRQFVAQNDLSTCVSMTGEVPFVESLRFIKSSTVGLCLLKPITNYCYAMPVKMIEYMGFGLPVISADLPCSRAYLGSCGAGIIVNPEDRKAMADAVAEMLSDPDGMLKYSRNGQRAVTEELNWEKEGELLLHFYRRMLGEPLEPGPCTPHEPRPDHRRNFRVLASRSLAPDPG